MCTFTNRFLLTVAAAISLGLAISDTVLADIHVASTNAEIRVTGAQVPT